MAGIEDLLAQIPIGDLAKKLGVDEATATAADPTTIDDVDEEDGSKIVANVFGGKQQDVAAALGSTGGSAGGGSGGGVDLGGGKE